MKLTYFQHHISNFGDQLNKIMWDELIAPEFFNDDESTLFLGIGSILWDHHPKKPKKIVMGSGYGGYTGKPNLHDGSWDVAFVRGLRTAKSLGLEPELAISDAAILTRFLKLDSLPKKYKVSFMPHFQSIPRGNWKSACELAGIHYIDPTDADVKSGLKEIQQSELLITEAMHGAILADTLRVPWVALEPIVPIHRNKWYDWSESLEIDIEFNSTPNSSIRDLLAQKMEKKGLSKSSERMGKLLSFTNAHFICKSGEQLLRLSTQDGQMSEQSIFENKSELALEKLAQYCKLK
jgi:succinoglycan biosynthesis protein ExoV